MTSILEHTFLGALSTVASKLNPFSLASRFPSYDLKARQGAAVDIDVNDRDLRLEAKLSPLALNLGIARQFLETVFANDEAVDHY